jgi:hypothetical protein
MAEIVFLRMVWDGIEASTTKLLYRLPVYLPPNLGGLSFPMDWETLCVKFDYELRWAWFIINEAPFDEFLINAVKLRTINGTYRRGLVVPDYSDLFRSSVSDLKPDLGVFDPEDTTKLYSLKTILLYYKENREDIPRSEITGLPRVKSVISDLYENYGFIPLSTILDQWDRYYCFYKAFATGVETVKLSVHRYARNLERFWKHIPNRYTSEELPAHKWRSLSDVSWAMSTRLNTIVHKDSCRDKVLSTGPTLNVALRRKHGKDSDGTEPLVRTQTGWDSIARGIVEDWLRQGDPDEELDKHPELLKLF